MKTRKQERGGVAQATLILPICPDVAEECESLADARLNQCVAVQTVAHVPKSIFIERLIIHLTDHKKKQWEFADTLANFDPGRDLFAEHIKKVIAESIWDARFVDEDGRIPTLCNQLLGTDDEFVESSQQLAQSLFDTMTMRGGNISRGNFVAAVYRQDDEKVRRVAIFKLDPESRQAVNVNRSAGQTHIDIVENDNIIPKPEDAGRLAKCALLTPVDRTSASGAQRFHIRLMDAQAGPRSLPVAAFFFRDFLKADLLPNARRQTQDFWRAASRWVDEHEPQLSASDKQVFYEARRKALSSGLAEGSLDLETFVQDALPKHADLQDGLLSVLRRSVFPAPEFVTMSASLVSVDQHVAQPLVDRVVFEFDRGVKLFIPDAEFRNNIRIESIPGQNKYLFIIETHTYREVER